VATVTAVDIHLMAMAVDTVGVTDGIMTDGVTVVDGVTMDMSLLAATVDGVMAVDLVTVVDSAMKGMVVAGSRIQDMAEVIAAKPNGHRISRTIV
jgi:hypothetical protein